MIYILIEFLIIICLLIFSIYYIIAMPGKSYPGQIITISPEEKDLSERLEQHVSILAGDIGERHIWKYENLTEACSYIKMIFTHMGYEPKNQDFRVQGKIVKNIEIEIPGTTYKDSILIIGAHYDTIYGSPGADDNASGVAAALEIARLLQNQKLLNTIRIVAFVNEEPPFFKTAEMGSLVYARRSKLKKEKIVGMITIESIGYYSDIEDSQSYPFPFSLFYPKKANFIAFVSNLHSRNFLHKAISYFRITTEFPSEGLSSPKWIKGVGWSDQWAFWKYGYPAIMITDTAFFRYGPYHTQLDTPNKLDYERMARVVSGINKVAIDIGNSSERF